MENVNNDENVHVAAVAPTPVVATATAYLAMSHRDGPETFNGTNFKRWQQKMLFYLTKLNLERFLTEDAPEPKEDEADPQVLEVADAWNSLEYLCRNFVLNRLSDNLYSIYSTKKSAKVLWDSLDHKYKAENAGTKKLIVGKFLNSKKWVSLRPNDGVAKKRKFKRKYFNCNKISIWHLIENFRGRIRRRKLASLK